MCAQDVMLHPGPKSLYRSWLRSRFWPLKTTEGASDDYTWDPIHDAFLNTILETRRYRSWSRRHFVDHPENSICKLCSCELCVSTSVQFIRVGQSVHVFIVGIDEVSFVVCIKLVIVQNLWQKLSTSRQNRSLPCILHPSHCRHCCRA